MVNNWMQMVLCNKNFHRPLRGASSYLGSSVMLAELGNNHEIFVLSGAHYATLLRIEQRVGLTAFTG